MFTIRCLSKRFPTRSILCRPQCYLSLGAANPQKNNEELQSTVNIIKQDLQLIHRDTLQVSTNKFIKVFMEFLSFRKIIHNHA